jgi:ERCC4-type nuclease
MIEIHADVREQRSGIVTSLKRRTDVEVLDAALPIGDFSVGGGIVIERKSAVDFINSITDGRFHEQMIMLSLNYQKPTVLIEGDIFGTRSKFAPHALAGAIAWIHAQGISLIPSSSTDTTAEIIYFMAKNAQTEMKDKPLRAKKPPITEFHARFVAESLPAIGPGNAKKALEHFGSLKALFNATPEQIMKIDRIGKDSAIRIWDVINWTSPNWKPSQSTFP